MRRLLYPNETLCTCVLRGIVSLCSLIQSHIETRLLVLIASALFDHRQPCSRCCTVVIYVLYKDTLFLLCTFCVADICVFARHCLFVGLHRPMYYTVCVCVSISLCSWIFGRLYFCVCVCVCVRVCAFIFMAQARFADMLAAVCRLRAVIANQDTGNRTTRVTQSPPGLWSRVCERDQVKEERETPAVVVLC